MTMTANGTIAQLGRSSCTAITLANCGLSTMMPEPDAAAPRVAMSSGTVAKMKPPVTKDLATAVRLIANERVQKDWSPKGPDIKPIAVGIPKATASAQGSTSAEDSPSATVLSPTLLTTAGANVSTTRRVSAMCMKSAVTDALSPPAKL